MRSRLRLSLPYFSILLIAVMLSSCSHEQPDLYQGYVEGEYLYLATPQGGYLGTLAVARGERVATGTPLFALDAEPAQHSLSQAQAQMQAANEQVRNLEIPRRPSEIAALEAQLDSAQAALVLSAIQLQQQEKLAQQNLTSALQLEQERAAYKRDKAQVEAIQKQLETFRDPIGRAAERSSAEAQARALNAQVEQQRWQVDKMRMSAPVAGEISDTYFLPGEWVPAGQPVVSLLPDDRRRVLFFVPQNQLAKVHLGDAVKVQCDGCKPVDATVDFIATQAEYTPPVIYSEKMRQKLVFRVEARPRINDAQLLRPGLPVDVQIARVNKG